MEIGKERRTILHCDCNGFYASVESILYPSLLQVPMAVCGDPESRHGIILAKNELAKGYGIKTAETIWAAKKKCPSLVLVPPHREEYRKYSALCNEIYRSYTDLVEPFGIDESWLDVTKSMHLFGSGKEIADAIRERIKKEVNLTVSVGVSFCKVFAKLGSDYKKPDATTVIFPEDVERIVWPLPVSALLYVGDSAAKKLADCHISTIGDLAHADKIFLTKLLGKQGALLHEYASGEDRDPVASAYAEKRAKSIGNGTTFRRDLCEKEEIRTGIFALSDQVAFRLRKAGLCALSVQITIRDGDFRDITRQMALQNPTHYAEEIAETAFSLYLQNWSEHKPIRMLTITAGNLILEAETAEQQSLFEPEKPKIRVKKEKLTKALDGIRDKYGKNSIGMGAILSGEKTFGSESDKTKTEQK